MGDQGDDQCGEYDGTDRQRSDANHVPFQMRQGDDPGAVHQQGRQEDDQDQGRIEHDGRHSRQEGQQCTARQQRNRWRQPEPMRHIMQGNDREQHRDHKFEQLHWFHEPCPLTPPSQPLIRFFTKQRPHPNRGCWQSSTSITNILKISSSTKKPNAYAPKHNLVVRRSKPLISTSWRLCSAHFQSIYHCLAMLNNFSEHPPAIESDGNGFDSASAIPG